MKRLALALLVISAIFAHAQPPAPATPTTLKDAYLPYLRVGAALNSAQFEERDLLTKDIIAANFNTISPENVLKWEVVQPGVDKYNFDPADKYVAFGEKHHMFIVGHCLVWHSQTPRWVFEDADGKPLTRDALLARMRDHIHTIVGRYKGRIQGWDVVNEAIADDGSMRQSNWYKIIGDDFIAKAFEYAHEADPAAELYYNDYSLENEAKRKGALALVKKLKAAGIPINGVGLQGHMKIDRPTPAVEAQTIEDFAALGVRVNISEFDIDVLPRTSVLDSADVSATAKGDSNSNPYKDGLPEEMQQRLAQRYAEFFQVFLEHSNQMGRITLWGVDDGHTWLNNFPTRGRTNHPLLWDRQGKPKPAFFAVLKTAIDWKAAHRGPATSTTPRPTGIELMKALTKPKGFRAPSEKDFGGYLLVYFKDQTQAAYLAVSKDGYTFTDINDGQPIFLGTELAEQKGVRDPHITRGPDGAFYLAMTDLHIFGQRAGIFKTPFQRPVEECGWGNNRALVLMKSYDLIHWSHSDFRVDTAFPALGNICTAWAPETIYDPAKKKMMVYFTMRYGPKGSDIYYAYTDPAFTRLETKPELLAHTDGADGDITPFHGKYELYFVSDAKIRHGVSSTLTGGYQIDPQRIDPEKVSTEAPTTFKRLGTDKYVLMYDVYGARPSNMGFSETTDFQQFTNLGRFNEGVMKTTNFTSPKHGAVTYLTAAELKAIADHWHVPLQ